MPSQNKARNTTGVVTVAFRLLAVALVAMALACTQAPRVTVSDIQSGHSSLVKTDIVDDSDFRTLVENLNGKQIGDIIFAEGTSAVLVTEALDVASLARARQSAHFGADEFEARLSRIQRIHRNFIVFSVELRLPFHAGWSRKQLLSFVRANLIVTLEKPRARAASPARMLFDIEEAFSDRKSDRTVNSNRPLGLRLPIRAFFRRPQNHFSIGAVVLKLRLRENLPYVLGFWDEQYYQGFQWQVVNNDSSDKRSTFK